MTLWSVESASKDLAFDLFGRRAPYLLYQLLIFIRLYLFSIFLILTCSAFYSNMCCVDFIQPYTTSHATFTTFNLINDVAVSLTYVPYFLPTQLPTITDLRNPTLKPRHWETIEHVLEYSFTPEDPLTLGKLMEIHAFKFAETIQEVSGQASSEASLESILKKVRVIPLAVYLTG